MGETNLTPDQEIEVESHAPYGKVFVALLVFTVLEYAYASFLTLPFSVLLFGLLVMAFTKAALVGIYFMHLKFEGPWVYALLVPAAILAVVLTTALIPDVVWQPVNQKNPDLKDIPKTPIQPGAAASLTRPLGPVA